MSIVTRLAEKVIFFTFLFIKLGKLSCEILLIIISLLLPPAVYLTHDKLVCEVIERQLQKKSTTIWKQA